MRCRIALFAMAVVLMRGSMAFAHPNHVADTHSTSFEAGLLHPLFGIDHLLAMLTVGILAARLGGRAVWFVPGAFLASMISGGYAGMMGMRLLSVELGIAASVIALGVAVAAGRNLPLGLLVGSCAVFGFLHGHAHGSEMPSMAQPMLYAAGFVLATAVLQAVGVGVGLLAWRTPFRQRQLQFTGVAIAVVGLLLMFRLI